MTGIYILPTFYFVKLFLKRTTESGILYFKSQHIGKTPGQNRSFSLQLKFGQHGWQMRFAPSGSYDPTILLGARRLIKVLMSQKKFDF